MRHPVLVTDEIITRITPSPPGPSTPFALAPIANSVSSATATCPAAVADILADVPQLAAVVHSLK